MLRLFIISCVAGLLCGCASYEYQLREPATFSQRIGGEERRLEFEPLIYHLRSYENRLVMRVQNPTTQPIELLGSQSSIVDPAGQSHPLRSQTIAPNSFIKLIFPPLRPRAYGTETTFGVGLRVDSGGGENYDRGGALYTEPAYLGVYDDGDVLYWDWKGESSARISLVYLRAGNTFRNEFVFDRVKRE